MSNHISTNVVNDTLRAIETSKDLGEAAGKLGLTEQGLRYRISEHPKLMALAIERGMYTPRKKADAVTGTGPSSTKGQFDKKADLSKPPEETKAPNPAPEPTAIQPRTARPRGHGRNKPGWKTFDVTMQEESYALLVEIADREDRHVNIQAGRMLREVLEQMK